MNKNDSMQAQSERPFIAGVVKNIRNDPLFAGRKRGYLIFVCRGVICRHDICNTYLHVDEARM